MKAIGILSLLSSIRLSNKFGCNNIKLTVKISSPSYILATVLSTSDNRRLHILFNLQIKLACRIIN